MRHLLIFLFTLSAFGQAVLQNAALSNAELGATVAGGGETCTLSEEAQTTNENNDTVGAGVIGSQYVASMTADICKVRMYLSTGAGGEAYVQLRSTYNGGDIQYGSNSSTETLTGTPSWYEFDFSPAVSVSGTFYINLVNSGGTTILVYSGPNSGYEGATGNFWVASSQWSRPSVFEVWSMQ